MLSSNFRMSRFGISSQLQARFCPLKLTLPVAVLREFDAVLLAALTDGADR
jgi:hypothetical protein|tara:strand:+ start:13807 stop:13959 length:153 start_codon:yes stop_codon:yes gene_type:complete